MGHQRKSVKPRSMLVYVAGEWAKVSVKEISRRLHRDPSIISRLYAAYAAHSSSRKGNTAGTHRARQASSRISLVAVNHSEPND